MKIVVIGGSGLIGKKLIPLLRGAGHEAVSACEAYAAGAYTAADQCPNRSGLPRRASCVLGMRADPW